MAGSALSRVMLASVLLVLVSGAAAHAGVPDRPSPELRRAVSQAVHETDSFRDRFHAEVWLTDMSRRLADEVPDPHERLTILKAVHYEANRAGLPPEMVLALIEVESDFNRFAISESGARGLMQIMPFWLDEIGEPEDNLFHIETNLRMGCTILAHYLDKEDGDWVRALARYNGSLPETWYAERVLDALSERWYRQ